MTDTFTAFIGHDLVAAGDLLTVANAVAAVSDRSPLIFRDASGEPVELDLRLGPEKAVAQYEARTSGTPVTPVRQGRGRPRLGVVAREVTLLPRHWTWLAAQPGGASAALRRLVEDAARAGSAADQARTARDTLYRIASALAGNLPNFENATRALFAADDATFDAIVSAWPTDVAAYLRRLATGQRAARSAAEPT